MIPTFVQSIIIFAIPVLFAVTVHEYAHGWAAQQLGDSTAKRAGRLTLNPIRHVDVLGTIIVPAILLMIGGFLFGWAKPVPVDVRNFRRPLQDMALVAAAGPFSNLLMALLWALLIPVGKTLYGAAPDIASLLVLIADAGVTINVALMVLNLLPLPPLDGGRIVSGFLPPHLAFQFNRVEPYGFIILVVLLAAGWLTAIIGPAILFVRSFILSL